MSFNNLKTMYKYFICLSLSIISFSEITSANNFEIIANFGYGLPIGKNLHFAEVDAVDDTLVWDYKYLSFNDRYSSLGNGLKGTLGMNYYFPNNLGIKLQLGLSVLGKIKIESQYNGYDLNSETIANCSFVELGITMRSNNDKIIPYLSISPGIYLPYGVKETSQDDEPGYRSKFVGEYKYSIGAGVSASAGLQIMLSDHFGLNFEVDPNYVFARVKEVYVTETDLESGEIFEYTVTFLTDENDLPESTEDHYYTHGGEVYSFSSLNLSFGVLFSF